MSARTLYFPVLFLVAFLSGAKGADKPATALLTPYQTAHSAALDAKEALVAEADNHTQYRIEFNGIKGDRVPALLYIPKRKANEACPTVLLQYGIGGNKKTDYIVGIGKEFVARGFVVLTIDAPGTGERKIGEKKTSAIMGLLGGDQVMHYCGDYSRAVDFLCTRAEVDKDRIGYFGISWGAITGVTFVAYEPRVKAMISLGGGANFFFEYTPRAAEKAAREGSKSSDPAFHAARIAPRPFLLVNGTKDQLILRPWAEALHKCAGDGAKVVWLETDHYLRGVDRTEVCRSVIDFMEKGLAPKTETGGK